MWTGPRLPDRRNFLGAVGRGLAALFAVPNAAVAQDAEAAECEYHPLEVVQLRATHDGWDERVKFIEAELSLIAA